MTAPSRRDYADAERLLREVAASDHSGRYLNALALMAWIEQTKPQRREPDLLTVMFACGVLLLTFITAVLLIEWAVR